MSSGILLKYLGLESWSWRIEELRILPIGHLSFHFRSCHGGIVVADAKTRAERDEFRMKIKIEWNNMWTERFDDKIRAEGIVVKEYPLLLVDRGLVIFANRDAKPPSFAEIVAYWASKGSVYCPEPSVGGWGKFARSAFEKKGRPRTRAMRDRDQKRSDEKRQLKKGGRGWLHV